MVNSEPSAAWIAKIEEAVAEPDRARSNHLITNLHYALSEALAERLGREGGPNFHSWAVWGSRKAGVTIRQEDLGSAIRNATVTAGIVGSIVGVVAGVSAARVFLLRKSTAAALGAAIGFPAGAATGRQIAVLSRRRAAELILEGNRTVLRDIGTQTARFLEMLEAGSSHAAREAFFRGLRPGSTECGGQERLASAFRAYLTGLDTDRRETKRAAMISGNCQIVYHEHIRLEPYIRSAMPFIIRRCATERLMTYEVGEKVFSVGENVPGIFAGTAARDWTNIQERMRYVFALFEAFHDAPEIFLRP